MEHSTFTNFLANVDADQYHFHGMWKVSPFAEYFWISWYNSNLAKKYSTPITFDGVVCIKGGYFYTSKKYINDSLQFLCEKYSAGDTQYFDVLKSDAQAVFNECIKQTHEAITITDDSEFMQKQMQIGCDLMFFWFYGWILGHVMDYLLIEECEKYNVPIHTINDYLPTFSTPLLDSQPKLRAIKDELINTGLWDMVLEDAQKALPLITDNDQVFALIKNYQQEYAWSTILSFVGSAITIEQIIEQISHITVHNEQKDVPFISDTFTKLTSIAGNLSYLRQAGAEYSAMYNALVMPRLQTIAQKLDLSYSELLLLLPNEINDVLNGTFTDYKTTVNKRHNENWAVVINDAGTCAVLDDKQKVNYAGDKLIPKLLGDASIIKGQVGNKGFYKGKVCVVLNNETFDKMQPGDVLVTTMTTPDFIMLMQKAGAIVTDIGGLLCHAAIVSREMGKPCVIGTHYASRVLKDGDIVEVDASKGVITVIK